MKRVWRCWSCSWEEWNIKHTGTNKSILNKIKIRQHVHWIITPCECVLTLQECVASIFTVTELGSHITDAFPLPKHPPEQNSVTQKMEAAFSLNHQLQLTNLHNDQHISISHHKTLGTCITVVIIFILCLNLSQDESESCIIKTAVVSYLQHFWAGFQQCSQFYRSSFQYL